MSLPYAEEFTFAGDDLWMSEFRLPANHPDWNSRRRTTDSVFLLAFPRTTVAIHQETRAELVADPLCAVVYNPGQPYRRRLISADGDRCTILAVSRRLVADAARPYARDAETDAFRLPFPVAEVARGFHSTLEQLRRRIANNTDADRDATQEELLWLLDHVVASGYSMASDRPTASSAHVELAHAVREELGRDLAASHSLAELSNHFAVSPFHLVRTFRAVTGRPIHAYRTELRLRASLPLIAEGVRLADVAQRVGFASHAHLTDRFVRAYGIAPARWRESSKNMEARKESAFIA